MSAVGGRVAQFVLDDVYHGILEHAPPLRPIARSIAQVASFACVPEWRRNLLCNARLALGPNASQLECATCAFRMLGAMQGFITDVITSRETSPAELCARVHSFEGTDAYLNARSLGRGAVITGIHLGPFEPALATLRTLEPRVHVLSQPDPMPRFERARRALRERLGIIEHHVSDGVRAWGELLDALRSNEVVVIHADRVMPGQVGVPMSFLGMRDAVLPPGPLRLAATHGSPIVPTFCARTRDGLRVWADGFIPTTVSQLSASDVAQHPAQQALIAAMERTIRHHPEQWMAFMNLNPTRASNRMVKGDA